MTWNDDGSFTAETDCLVTFDMILKNEGRYDLTIQSEDKSGISEVEIDGHAVAFDTATGTCPAEDELGGGTDSSVTLRLKAGTTVQRVAYMKE